MSVFVYFCIFFVYIILLNKKIIKYYKAIHKKKQIKKENKTDDKFSGL